MTETMPGPVVSGEIAVAHGWLLLRWQRVNYATGYKIYRAESFVEPPPSTPIISLGDSIIYFDELLSTTTEYHYWITAFNTAGESDYFYLGYGIPYIEGTPTVTRPSAPSNVTAVRVADNKTYVVVRWNAVPGATSYNIYSGYTSSVYPIGSSGGPLFVATNISTSGGAIFRVSSVNSAGESGQSSAASVEAYTGGNASIRVENRSTTPNHNLKDVVLLRGASQYLYHDSVNYNGYFSFSAILADSNSNYRITAKDSSGNTYTSGAISVLQNQSKTVTFNGTGFVVSD
jgi:hypothetical protein